MALSYEKQVAWDRIPPEEIDNFLHQWQGMLMIVQITAVEKHIIKKLMKKLCTVHFCFKFQSPTPWDVLFLPTKLKLNCSLFISQYITSEQVDLPLR